MTFWASLRLPLKCCTGDREMRGILAAAGLPPEKLASDSPAHVTSLLDWTGEHYRDNLDLKCAVSTSHDHLPRQLLWLL